jgi:hypothetical protein
MKIIKRAYLRWFVKMARIKQAQASAYVVNFNKEYTK